MKMYDGWMNDAATAAANWRVTHQFEDGAVGPRGGAAEFQPDWLTRYVEAAAGTGSRYGVHVARVGSVPASMVGNSVLVTVVWPWQDAWALAEDGYLTMDYVAEHLTRGAGADGRLNGGDLAAVTMTICHALGRQHDVVMSVAQSRSGA